jgi:hypothetical protein
MNSIHAKCLAVDTTPAGHFLVCAKSPEHVRSNDPARREHYDPSAEQRWTDEKPNTPIGDPR